MIGLVFAAFGAGPARGYFFFRAGMNFASAKFGMGRGARQCQRGRSNQFFVLLFLHDDFPAGGVLAEEVSEIRPWTFALPDALGG